PAWRCRWRPSFWRRASSRPTRPAAPRSGSPRSVAGDRLHTMFRLLRLVFWLFAIVCIVWFSTSVPLGNATLWGHIQKIWKSQETQDMVKGTEDAAKPAIDKVKKAVKTGVDEVKHNP